MSTSRTEAGSFPSKPLELGDIVWHEGRRYRVVHIGTDPGDNPVVTVEPEPDNLGDLLNSERGGILLVPLD